MSHQHLLKRVRPWLERELGVSIERLSHSSAVVLATEPRSDGSRRLWAVRIQDQGIVTVPAEWRDPVRRVVNSLLLDEVFSVFGAYELARVTLPLGTAVFGPTWYLVADGDSFVPVGDARPDEFETNDLAAAVDPTIFWHCSLQHAVIAHAIFEENRLAALATTRLLADLVFEIGVDVAPEAKGHGLGRAVVSAAGEWILKQGGLIVAGSAPWNVPSVRTMRSLGLRLVFTDMDSHPAPFRLPPQPLGLPHRDAQVYDYYPSWAMNSTIRPADETKPLRTDQEDLP